MHVFMYVCVNVCVYVCGCMYPTSTSKGGPTKWVLELLGWSWAILGPRSPPDLSKRALGPILVDFWIDFGRFGQQIWWIC